MKNNYSIVLITYFLTALFLVVASLIFIPHYNFSDKSIVFKIIISTVIAAILSFLFHYFTKLSNRKKNIYLKFVEEKYSKLEAANERYDIVSKATSDTIWDWDITTGKFIWNKGINGIFGYKKDQVTDNLQWWFDKIHPEDSLKMSVKLYAFIAEKSDKWQDAYRFRCADGSYKYVFNRGFLVKDEKNNVVRMIGAIQDVTKQKTEEQRLKLLETVITQTKDAIIISETNDNESEVPKILFVNQAFSTMTEFSQEEVIGELPTVFLSRDSVRSDIKKISDAFKKKEEFTFEALNHKKSGEKYWINFSMIPITNSDHQHSHWISILRDITIEKQQQEEREQLISELTQNNKDLKQFSYITSHNLRAPLSNLTGLLNLIKDIPIENEELKEIINGFSKSTNVLNETINDLVKVIIIKDSPSIQKEEILIRDVFESVFNQLSFLINTKKPIILMNFDTAPNIKINKSYFESILLNLTTNSLKYNNEKKQLKISISSKIIDNAIEITFKDNGIGIDLALNKDKIFGLYQRFHDYPDSKGLGLYLVKSQVESMGGTISVSSTVGEGTTFKILFKTH